MCLALWTCYLIFMENFFLGLSYSNNLMQVTNDLQYPELKQPFASYQETTSFKSRYDKVDRFVIISDKYRKSENSTSHLKKPTIRHENSSHRRKLKNKPITNSIDSEFAFVSEMTNDDEKYQQDEMQLSPVSQYKLDKLGTDEKVRQEFQKKFGTLPSSRINESQFLEFYRKAQKETSCKLPSPKIVKVNDLHSNAFKTYYPACMIIHQCTEDSGCCSDIKQKCLPSKMENVTLPFKVKIQGKNYSYSHIFETLSFTNHTECKCMESEDRKARDIAKMPTKVTEATIAVENKNCICPTPYSIRIMADGSCACDCYDRQQECILFKKGFSKFSQEDLFCIIQHKCTFPTCSYGDLILKAGRCPMNNEKY